MKRGQWSSKLGLYMAAVGAAFGLGNFWRFPYLIAENGGGAFIFIFLLLVFLVGLPILTLEFIFGKVTGQSIVLGLRQLVKKPGLRWLGWLPVGLGGLILVYYSFVAGWVLHFVLQFLRESVLFFEEPSLVGYAELSKNVFWQLSLTSAHLVFVGLIILKGVEEGLEKALKYLTPLALIVITIMIVSLLRLPGKQELLRYLFYPDFTLLTQKAWLSALGHVFFTMNLGVGMMVTYGSYYKQQAHLPTMAFRITVMDALVSLAAAVMVFGVAIALGYQNVAEPGLLFLVLPDYFFQFPSGAFLGLAFFLTLYLVSILASIGLLEVLVSNLGDVLKISRPRALCWSAGGVFLGSVIFVMVSYLSENRGPSIFANFDILLIEYMLPILGVLGAWVMQKYLPRVQLRRYFIDEDIVESVALYREWRVFLKWVLPLILIVFLIVKLL